MYRIIVHIQSEKEHSEAEGQSRGCMKLDFILTWIQVMVRGFIYQKWKVLMGLTISIESLLTGKTDIQIPWLEDKIDEKNDKPPLRKQYKLNLLNRNKMLTFNM